MFKRYEVNTTCAKCGHAYTVWLTRDEYERYKSGVLLADVAEAFKRSPIVIAQLKSRLCDRCFAELYIGKAANE